MKVPLISSLAARAEAAEYTLQQLRRLHVASDVAEVCVGCQRRWPCASFRILDGA